MTADDGTMWLTIYDTLQRSMGRWVSPDRLHEAADDLTEALGGSKGCRGDLPPRSGPDAPLVNAIQRLLEFHPENGYDPAFAAYVAGTEWADDKDPAVQEEALDDRPAWAARQAGNPVHETVKGPLTGRPIKRRLVPDTGPVPLLSQPVYYPILGKEDGRTLNAHLREVRRLAGLDDDSRTPG